MVDALKRASAGSISAVVPYFGYARQDRKSAPRAPISARLVTDLLHTAGINRIITMELHAGKSRASSMVLWTISTPLPVFTRHLENLELHRPVMVSPDAGGVEMARTFAKRLNMPLWPSSTSDAPGPMLPRS